MSSIPLDETRLRHPLEQPIFVASVVFNLMLMAAALILANAGTDWLAQHPFIHQNIKTIKMLATAAVLAPPAIVFIRNMRRASVLGNSVLLSREQLPEIFEILEQHCKKLGGMPIPELYLTDRAVPAPSQAFSTWWQNSIALNARFIERKPAKSRDVISFMIGRELGRLRLGHTKWWYEVLLAYMDKIPYARNPLTQVQTLSHDRYGAYLEPNALPGLLILASGRRLVSQVRPETYLENVRPYGGIWAVISDLPRTQPHISYRVAALVKADLLHLEPGKPWMSTGEEKEKKKKDKDKKKNKQKVEVEPTEQMAAPQ